MHDIPLILSDVAVTSRDDTPRERRYYVWTVGCQMNISDSERLESALQSVGYVPASEPGGASFVVLNSCSVRASAEERIFGKLGDLQRFKKEYPDMKVVLWGCMVGPNNESIFKSRHYRLSIILYRHLQSTKWLRWHPTQSTASMSLHCPWQTGPTHRYLSMSLFNLGATCRVLFV